MSALAIKLDDMAAYDTPSPTDMEKAVSAARALNDKAIGDRRLKLCRADGAEEIELPQPVFAILLKMLVEIGNGNTVAVIPVHSDLTTTQAASLLNISRPHLTKLLERGELPFHMVGTHRKLVARDVLAYKEKTMARRRAALAEMTRIDEELELRDAGNIG